MKQYKWCICDMDGTLLNSKDEISKEDEAALKKLQELGVEVMIASGRLDLMVKRYIHQLDLQGHVISCNGGLIRNVHTGEIIYSNAMDQNIVREILTYSLDNKIDILVYTPHCMFSSVDNSRAIRYANINKELLKNLRFEVRYINTDDMSEMEGLEILKVLLSFPTHQQAEYHVKKYAKCKQLEVVSSFHGLVDIMAAGSSKGRALKLLADMKKVDLEDIIAFGDNYNDIDLLQNVGMSVAMENSVQDLKEVAKYRTKSNNESGVAYALDKYIFHDSNKQNLYIM